MKRLYSSITAGTKELNEAVFSHEESNSKKKKLIATIKLFRAYRMEVLALLEALGESEGITEEDIRKQEKPMPLLYGTVVVLAANPNDHNYPLEKPLFVGRIKSCGSAEIWYWVEDEDGDWERKSEGNIPPCDIESYRAATDDEIAFVIERLKEEE